MRQNQLWSECESSTLASWFRARLYKQHKEEWATVCVSVESDQPSSGMNHAGCCVHEKTWNRFQFKTLIVLKNMLWKQTNPDLWTRMSSVGMFSTYIHLYPTGDYFWTDTKAHLSCILKLEHSTHSQRCLLLNGSEMTNNVSVETCWVPFKVNYELINAFQNLRFMSATVSWAVRHQKHIHTHSELEENPSPRKRTVPSHVLTHIHTLKVTNTN